MPKKTTKKNRKKNLSAKPLVQYVTNEFGTRFVMKGGKLFRTHKYKNGDVYTQSIRLRDLRETLTTDIPAGLEPRVSGIEHDNTESYGTNWSVRREGSGDDLLLAIGCQTFRGNNAAKILKRARVAV